MLSIPAEKKLKGDKDIEKDMFKFELYRTESDYVKQEDPTKTAWNDVEGNVEFADIKLDKAGVHYFIVKETDLGDEGMEYDTSEYRISVEVTDNGEGQLIAGTPVIVKAGESTAVDAIVFNNEYTAPAVTPTPTPKPTPKPTTPPTVPPTATIEPTLAPTPIPTAEPTPEPWPLSWITSIKTTFGGGSIWYLLAAVFLIIALIIMLIVVSSGKRKKKRGKRLDPVDISGSMRESHWSSQQGTIRDGGENDPHGTQRDSASGGTVRDDKRSPYAAASPSHGTVRIQKNGGMPTSGTVLISTRKQGVELHIQESRGGSVNEHVVYLDKQITVGREYGCDLRINDDTVSSAHLRITHETDGLYVRDLNSSNGTRINGEDLHGSRPLHSRDILVVGRTTLTIHFDL